MRNVSAVVAAGGGPRSFWLLAPLLACARQGRRCWPPPGSSGADRCSSKRTCCPCCPSIPSTAAPACACSAASSRAGWPLPAGPSGCSMQLLPAVFGTGAGGAGAAVSALVEPGHHGPGPGADGAPGDEPSGRRCRLAGPAAAARPALAVAARLAQIWLLLDLAHETDLSVRDLEATGCRSRWRRSRRWTPTASACC